MNIELQNISKRFGLVQANSEVSLVVEAGSIHGLLGENGAGKSTLVKILSGFIRRDRGQVLLNGKSAEILSPAEAIQAGVGMLHQDPLDFPPLSVLDNFLIGRSQGWWFSRKQALRELRNLADRFNFTLDGQEQTSQLTVGERQQLEILRLLSLGVQTLILDEPTTGISTSQKTALFAAMKQLAAQGKSIIFVSHKLEDVEVLCDRVTVMRQGRVVDHAEIPCPHSTLVTLMFGKELALPVKPHTRREDVLLQLQQVKMNTDRLHLSLGNLTIYQGEVIGLAGLEGNGQELLLRCCAGLLRVSQGCVCLSPVGAESIDITNLPYQDYLKLGIAYVPADRLQEGLVGDLSIQEHVALRLPNPTLFINWTVIRQTAQQAIALFNIRGNPNTPVERLSGGNQQRTQLALMPTPLNLLLMEHPTRGLDIESTLWVWQQLITRCQTGTAILFMSSDLDEIMQYSDRVLVFSGGKVSAPISVGDLTLDSLGQMIGGKLSPVPVAPLPN